MYWISANLCELTILYVCLWILKFIRSQNILSISVGGRLFIWSTYSTNVRSDQKPINSHFKEFIYENKFKIMKIMLQIFQKDHSKKIIFSWRYLAIKKFNFVYVSLDPNLLLVVYVYFTSKYYYTLPQYAVVVFY